MKKSQNRTARRPRRPAAPSARKAKPSAQLSPDSGHAMTPPVASAVPDVLPPQILPTITASLDLPVGPEALIDSVIAKFERFVMDQIRSGEQACAAANRQLTDCEQQLQKVAHRAAERLARSAQPHLEQARRALNLRGDLQFQCEVICPEQDNGLPLVSVEATFFTEKRSNGYSGCTYADELQLSFEISLSEMADDGDEPQQAWQALQASRQDHRKQTELLIAWRKKLAEIPYVQRQAKAHLTDVLLQQTEPGRQLYQTLRAQLQEDFADLPTFNAKSLPA
jgi:hypothetical protein